MPIGAILTEAQRRDIREHAKRRAGELAQIGDLGLVEYYRKCGAELPVVTVNKGPLTLTQGATTAGTSYVVPMGKVAVPVAIRQMTTPLVQKRVTGWPIRVQTRDNTNYVYPFKGARPADPRMWWPDGKGPSLSGIEPFIEGMRITPAVVLGAGENAKAIFELDLLVIPADEYFACGGDNGRARLLEQVGPREDELLFSEPWNTNTTRNNSGVTPQVTLAAEVGAEHVLQRIKALFTAGGPVTLNVGGTSRTIFTGAAGQAVNWDDDTHAGSNAAVVVSFTGGGNLELSGKTYRLRGT